MKLILLIIIVYGIAFSQDEEKESNQCIDPPISYARKYGVKALPVKDLPHYFKVSKACKEMGGDVLIDQISIN